MTLPIIFSRGAWMAAIPATFLIAAPQAFAAESATPAADSLPADAQAQGTLSFPEGQQYAWRLQLEEGAGSSAIALPPAERKGDTWHFRTGRFDIDVIENASPRGYTELLVSIRNKTDKELWLEPRISIDIKGKGVEWFDGQQERKVFSRREQLTGSLPFASVQHSGVGVALGIDPRQMVSHFRAALRKSKRVDAELEYSSRMVVAPGEVEERRFVAFAYQPDFGYLNAVQRYWQFFPENFSAHKEIAPNVKGTVFGNIVWMNQHFQYHDGPKGKFNDKVSEVVRWVGGGWEWCYAGYGSRPGDWLCTEEDTFDWKVNPEDPKSPEKTTKLRDVFKRSAKEHLEGLMGNYSRLEKHGVDALMYIIPSYCEEELALQKYSDSIYRDTQGAPRSAGPPWVGRYDKGLQMYPYGNSFGDYTFDAIKEIAARTPGLRGFSFDCIDRSNYFYTGPGVSRSPGKAYDEKLGVYVNSETAHAKFGEAVHAIEKDGYRLALSGNYRATSGSYLSAQAMDAAIIEHTPWDDRPRPDLIRLNMGTKSVTFLHGYERVPEVSKQSATELTETARMLQDFSILQAFRYGIYPSWKSALGSPKMIHYFEIFNDLFRNYGWQPAVGARGDERLWISRYGAARGGLLSVGNATDEKITSTVEILPSYFGGASVAFVDYEGRESVETLAEEKGARISEGAMAPASVRLYAAALIWPEKLEGKISGSRTIVPGGAVTDRVILHPARPAETLQNAFAPDRPGFRIAAVRQGEKPLKFTAEQGGVAFSHPMKEVELTIEYQPLIGIASAASLENLPFLREDQSPGFQIILTEDTLATRREAMKLASFFSAYRFGLDKVDRVVHPAILTDAAKADPSLLSIYIGSEASRAGTPLGEAQAKFADGEIFVQGNTIGLFGREERGLSGSGNLLLKLITPRYPHYGRFHISEKSIAGGAGIFDPSLLQKVAGIDYLPWEQAEIEKPASKE